MWDHYNPTYYGFDMWTSVRNIHCETTIIGTVNLAPQYRRSLMDVAANTSQSSMALMVKMTSQRSVNFPVQLATTEASSNAILQHQPPFKNGTP